MKTAIIFYSFDGNCALLAEHLKTSLKADAFEIKTVAQKKRSGFAKFAWGLMMMLKKPAIQPLSVDINAYELIVLGAPVWGGAPASPFVSFLKGTVINGKNIAFFCSHGGGMGKIFEKFRSLLSGNTIVGEIEFNSPTKQDSAVIKEKLDEWVKTFRS